jgi:hypothetical protein
MEHRDMVTSLTWTHQKENGKRKPRRFSLIRLPFAHRANGSLSYVRMLTNGNYPFANGLNGLAHLWTIHRLLLCSPKATTTCLYKEEQSSSQLKKPDSWQSQIPASDQYFDLWSSTQMNSHRWAVY